MDYIGNLGSCTIGDLLPDKLLIQPTGDTYTRSGKRVRVGLYAFICPACGKHFETTMQHRYKETYKGGFRMYCSYTCFRPVEKAMEDKFKANCLGFVAENGRDKPPIERARIRVEKCKREIQKYIDLRNDPERWNALTRSQRASRTSTYGEWRRKLEEAQETLQLLEQEVI